MTPYWWGRCVFGLAVLLGLAAIEAAVRTKTISPAIYAAPSDVLASLAPLVARKGLLAHALATLGRTLAAFGLGSVLGATIAALLFAAPQALRRPAEGFIDFLRSIPATALFPVFIAAFGIGNANKIAVGASAAMFIVAVGLHAALREAASRFATVIAFYRPSLRTQWVLLLGPAAIPPAIATARLAISACLVLVVVSEMLIGSQSGLGYLINDLQYGDDRAGQYAVVLVTGVIGYAFNAGLELARRMFADATD